MTMPASDEDFARAFAPLLEVQQRGQLRPATPNDVLELLDGENGRYVLKGERGYLANKGAGWSDRQRDAIRIPDRAFAHEARRQGLRENGVSVKVVRIRRRGSCGIEAVRMRPWVDVKIREGGDLDIGVGKEEAMTILAALTGAKSGAGEQ
jgi:hypothetical protein